MIAALCKLARDARGSVVIETAFVVPVLILMAVGAFESGHIVSRHVELQNAVAEAAQIALSAPPNDPSERTTLKAINKTSTGLADEKIVVNPKFRCGTDTELKDLASECPSSYASFVQITLSETYTPIWKKIAFGSDINYTVSKLVQIG